MDLEGFVERVELHAGLTIKRTLALILALVLVISCLTACDSGTDGTDEEGIDSVESSDKSGLDLVDNPTEEYIIACLKDTPNVMEISAVTADNDPNGKLNTENGYYSAVFFSVVFHFIAPFRHF